MGDVLALQVFASLQTTLDGAARSGIRVIRNRYRQWCGPVLHPLAGSVFKNSVQDVKSPSPLAGEGVDGHTVPVLGPSIRGG